MSTFNRRDLLAGLTALAATGSLAEAQLTVPPSVPVLNAPRIFPYADLPVRHNANGSDMRSVMRGTAPSGEAIEVHESTIPVGAEPNPAHKHSPTDILLVREGTVAFEHDGKSEHVGPGGVILAASMTMHTIRNVGEVPAKYFVVSIGREPAKQLV